MIFVSWYKWKFKSDCADFDDYNYDANENDDRYEYDYDDYSDWSWCHDDYYYYVDDDCYGDKSSYNM